MVRCSRCSISFLRQGIDMIDISKKKLHDKDTLIFCVSDGITINLQKTLLVVATSKKEE